jgi:hypothetical protein
MLLPLLRRRVFPGAMLALCSLAFPVHGATLFNGSFENIGSATASFSINNPTLLPNWSLSPSPSGNFVLNCLIVAGAPASGPLCSGNVNGWTLGFWQMPGPSPDGGNFVAIDGDQNFSRALQQTVTGLVVGQQYNVSFYQAAAQQSGYDGATTERWQVSLGTETKLSTLMNNPNHGMVGWMSQTLSFTADATSEVLSFLAVGTPNGLPPFVLIDGITVTAQTPEPGSYALLGLGLLGIGAARWRRKKGA